LLCNIKISIIYILCIYENLAMTEKTTTQKKENLGSMSLRVDRDLLKAFQTIAKENNRNASMLLRDYMANYVKKHGQGDLFK
jgi:uncharacterized protein (DUF4415 family)